MTKQKSNANVCLKDFIVANYPRLTLKSIGMHFGVPISVVFRQLNNLRKIGLMQPAKKEFYPSNQYCNKIVRPTAVYSNKSALGLASGHIQ
ncbi:MAG: hypothetical protein EAZ35_02315 [Sphingobacteriia bacterium]|nr:MAG: hypothetical protein EAZ35_02315 [Sphingobacteriia bacterium]